MSEEQKRILFLCAHRSVRELMAASLLAAHEQKTWDIWIAPAPFPSDEVALVCQVLDEIHVPLFSSPKQQSHPLTTHGMKGLSSVVGQPINDRSFLTPVSVNSGPLKIFHPSAS